MTVEETPKVIIYADDPERITRNWCGECKQWSLLVGIAGEDHLQERCPNCGFPFGKVWNPPCVRCGLKTQPSNLPGGLPFVCPDDGQERVAEREFAVLPTDPHTIVWDGSQEK